MEDRVGSDFLIVESDEAVKLNCPKHQAVSTSKKISRAVGEFVQKLENDMSLTSEEKQKFVDGVTVYFLHTVCNAMDREVTTNNSGSLVVVTKKGGV